MKTVSVAAAKAQLSDLLEQVAAGEEVLITRHGKPIARVIPLEAPRKPLPPLASFRAQFPLLRKPAGERIREMRDEDRY
ncbi:MAG: type II toxin-antitoxin system prevent-host-death family antitoxin [Casimicrobiaceae bacterium]